jgi:hypothetical protein
LQSAFPLTAETAAAPQADAETVELPRCTPDFRKRFYGDATPARWADVQRQLIDSLSPPGATFDHETRVRAGSLVRLDTKMRQVIAEGVRDPDKAIVVLLTKLSDVSDDSAPGAVQARREQDEVRHDATDLAKAMVWLNKQPKIAAAIDRDLEAKGLKAGGSEWAAGAYTTAYNGRAVAAWREHLAQ